MTAPPALALVRRELLTSLRNGRSFLFASGVVALAIIIVGAVWPEGAFMVIKAGQVSADINSGMLFVALAACFVFIPGLAGAALTSERENDTFEMLSLTLVRPSGIIAAKLVNVLAYFFLLLIAIMPVTATVFFLVGTDWRDLLVFFFSVAFLSIQLGLIGLACSAVIKRTYVAVIMSYVMVQVAFLFYTLFFAEIIPLTDALPSPFKELLALIMVLGSYIVVCAACFAVARAALLRAPDFGVKRLPPIVVQAPRLHEIREGAGGTPAPQFILKRPIPDRQNPMYAKEARWGAMNRPVVMCITFTGAFMVFAATALIGGVFTEGESDDLVEYLVIMIISNIVMSLFMTSALTTNSLTKEREAGNLDFLRLTLLTPVRIILGKLHAGIRAALPLIAASMTLAVGFALFRSIDHAFTVIATGAATFAVCVLASLSLGLLASSLARKSITAVFAGYVLAIVFFVGIFAAVGFTLDEATSIKPDVVIRYLSPLVAYAMAVASPQHQADIADWVIAMVLCAAAVPGIVALTVFSFSRRWMRDR